jgi:TolB protein
MTTSARYGLPPALLLSALLLPLVTQAQPAAPIRDAGVIIHPGRSKAALALPRPIGGNPKAEAFYAVLKRDLEISGYFTIIDPKSYVEPATAGISLGQFKFDDWDIIGASMLAKTSLTGAGSGLRVEVQGFDVAGRQRLAGNAFTNTAGSDAAVRILAHKAADAIIFMWAGKHLPFNTRFAASVGGKGKKEIYTVDFDGKNLASVTRNGSINIEPAWDKVGRRLAYTSFVAGNPDLYVTDLSSGKAQRVSHRSGINTSASWHPGGNLLALTLSPGNDPDIFTIDARTGAQVGRITQTTGIDVAPAFSPDGGRIAFVSERAGGAQIYVAAADGSGAKRVTFEGGHNVDPAWSPDGKKLAYVSRQGSFDIKTVDLESGAVTRITGGTGDNEDPSWSPDGEYIAFSSTRAGGSHIWMSTADGAHQVQLTEGGGGFHNPAWSPSYTW